MVFELIKKHWVLSLVLSLVSILIALISIPKEAWIFDIKIIDITLGAFNLILKILNYKAPIYLLIVVGILILGIILVISIQGKQYFYNFSGVRWKLRKDGRKYKIAESSAYCPKCNEKLDFIVTDRFNGMPFFSDKLLFTCRSCEEHYFKEEYGCMREILDHLEAFIESGKINPGDLEEIPD